jgi:hypothetical protein
MIDSLMECVKTHSLTLLKSSLAGYRSRGHESAVQVLAAENPSVKQNQNTRFDLCLYLFGVTCCALGIARIVFRYRVDRILWAKQVSRHSVLSKLFSWSKVGDRYVDKT